MLKLSFSNPANQCELRVQDPKFEGWREIMIFNIYKNRSIFISISKIILQKYNRNRTSLKYCHYSILSLESKTRCSVNERKYYSALHVFYTSSSSVLFVCAVKKNKRGEFCAAFQRKSLRRLHQHPQSSLTRLLKH